MVWVHPKNPRKLKQKEETHWPYKYPWNLAQGYTGLQWSDSNQHQSVGHLQTAPKHRYSPSLDPTPNLWLSQNNKHIEGLTLAIVRTGMKGMTETKRVGGNGIDVRPTWTSDMQSCKRWAVMQHAVKQITGYITQVHIQTMTIRWKVIQTSCLKKIKIIYKQVNQYVESNGI